MIDFYSETDFLQENDDDIIIWINQIIEKEGLETGEIVYVFCDDTYLLNLNKKYLNHDSLTDIISFDNRIGDQINGEIYISIERVKENSKIYKTTFLDELNRVIIHGILHFCGYKDKSEEESRLIRLKEDEALELFKSI